MSAAWPQSHNPTATPTANGTNNQNGTINAYNNGAPSSNSASSSSSASTSTSTPEMAPSISTSRFPTWRTFNIRAHGVVATLRTSVPGKLTISLPSLGDRFRSKSEPIPPLASDDVEMGDPHPAEGGFQRARSEFTVRIPESAFDMPMPSVAELDESETTAVEEKAQDKGKERERGPEQGRESQRETSQEQEQDEESQPWTSQYGDSQPVARALSCASTEVFDTPVEDVKKNLVKRGIKIRDFAYPAPAPSSSQPSSTSHQATPLPSTSLPAPDPNLPALNPTPAAEIFDPIKGLSECDYRWAGRLPRRYPVQGKTLRRLLDMGWLSEEEVRGRAAPMDLAHLAVYDARPGPAHPWRALRVGAGAGGGGGSNGGAGEGGEEGRGARPPPTMAQREINLKMLWPYWRYIDGNREKQENYDKWARENELQVEVFMRTRAADWVNGAHGNGGAGNGTGVRPAGSKRTLDEREREGGDSEDGRDPKRPRRTPEPESQDSSSSSSQFQSQSQSQSHSHSHSQPQSQPYWQEYPAQYTYPYPYIAPPLKQYPAPLHSYDPEVYPEAASVIESSSQLRNNDLPPASAAGPSSRPSSRLERTDTPPLDGDDEGDGRCAGGVQGGVGGGATRANRLVHPKEKKAMKRALSRTQTYTQLIV